MKNITLAIFTILSLLYSGFSLADPTGYCISDEGIHHSVLSFAGTKISASQNQTQQVITKQVDNGGQYKGVCYCLTDKNAYYDYIYYTAKPNPVLSETSTRNGVTYYDMNQYLDVGLSIMVLGKSYVNVPFEYVRNNPGSRNAYHCKNGIDDSGSFTSGSDATIYFYIKQPFIGKLVIPQTLLARLYSTLTATDPLRDPLSDVYISGDITAPQECEINGGQIINFDFKTIPASEFSSTAGAALTARKILVTASVKCSGIADGQGINVSLHATPVATDSTMIQTSNPDVGLKIYDMNNNEVDVNGGQMEATMGKRKLTGKMDGNLDFGSAPASATGARPRPGEFTATATLTVEIKK
nr:fimbrial protein [uncultured Enterobacter sp.]